MVSSHVSQEGQSFLNRISAKQQGVGAGNTISTNSATASTIITLHPSKVSFIAQYP